MTMSESQGSGLLYGSTTARARRPGVCVGSLVLLDPERRFVGFGDRATSLTDLGVFKEEPMVAHGRVRALQMVGAAAGAPVSVQELCATIVRGPAWRRHKTDEQKRSAIWVIMRTLRAALSERLVVNAIAEVDKGRWCWAREDLALHACVYTPTGIWLPEEAR